MLQHAGPLREDGSDRFFGFENFGNTCYCNSIVQALFYSDLFRENVIRYPKPLAPDSPNSPRPRVNVSIRPPMNPISTTPQHKRSPSMSQAGRQRQALSSSLPVTSQIVAKPEDKPDSPEYKKKQAMIKGPILELAQENAVAYGMDECTFTGLKDIFLALLESSTRTGVLSPQRFLEIFKRDNELFRNSMHQDAHEFYGLVLNDVIANVEANAKRLQSQHAAKQDQNGVASCGQNGLEKSAMVHHSAGPNSPGTGWVHNIFEGLLTSETRCLTCETASQRDETFLDLSIDLEEHASVTSCLRKFSVEEILCEGNKFHCDRCGGLQEAEKRMKVKRLPRVLTLHLKRFKYTEDYSRLQKLFHRVVYPYHLRMFNTTEDAEDPDRLYELYAVVVHIGGNAYHGHYVSIIKTKDRGWVLFDDEMVEPVDKHFVRNFFGDKPGMATAYVLFYQETTFDKVREEQEKEGREEVKLATEAACVAHDEENKADANSLKRQTTQPSPIVPEHDSMANLTHTRTAPDGLGSPQPGILPNSPGIPAVPSLPPLPPTASSPVLTKTPMAKQDGPTKEDKKREKKEREAVEKAAKQAEKEREKQAKESEKEKTKQAKEEEHRRREEQLNRFYARIGEEDDMQRGLDESNKTSDREEEDKKRESNGASSSMVSFLDRSRRGSRLAKRSLSFFHHHKERSNGEVVPPVPAVEVENGSTPEKQAKQSKSRLNIGLGRRKSNNLLS
ncbi:hypothetical protein CDD82_5732 [Ophiocordyceps australis]|uniref:Ubiquitin carboxyl-terminal hydrolase n=1 Tax=Ophiocordyceps australis TaxID=1399860 RepID=A0A2C5Y4A6_9HYPO|nr:hypothetical protein CDD82_5732 [Ophiocordyceps australis]